MTQEQKAQAFDELSAAIELARTVMAGREGVAQGVVVLAEGLQKLIAKIEPGLPCRRGDAVSCSPGPLPNQYQASPC